jgi:hypothetical protein
MSIIYKDIKTPELQASIVEPILLRCTNKVSFYVLALAIQQIVPMSFSDLKKYLFYLIDYGFVSYNGQEQMFTIRDEGFGLLDMIDVYIESEIERGLEGTGINDIVITFEYT